jgi:hypothetical protein
MKKNRKILPLFFCFLAIVLISPGSFRTWRWNGVALINVPLGRLWNVKPQQFDSKLTHEQDCLEKTDQKVKIFRCSGERLETIWKNPENWQVKEVVVADLNKDGIDEIGLLVWRPFEPWPIDKYAPNGGRIANFHDQNNQSCHFILIGWDGTKYRELWAGSALADPISHIKAADIDNDGFEELLALETEYDASSGGNLTVWEWQGFGFTLLDRLEGNFSNYSIVRNNGQLIVLTN